MNALLCKRKCKSGTWMIKSYIQNNSSSKTPETGRQRPSLFHLIVTFFSTSPYGCFNCLDRTSCTLDSRFMKSLTTHGLCGSRTLVEVPSWLCLFTTKGSATKLLRQGQTDLFCTASLTRVQSQRAGTVKQMPAE